jgi:DNA repair exonuclease SbcCD ATPase subunit
VSQAEPSPIETLQAEITHLKGELQLRDQLVDQLSQEVFRLIANHPPNGTPPSADPENYPSQLERLNAQIAEIDEQVQFYQKQLGTRDTEIHQLQNKLRTVTERNQSLEQLLQELPELYREKFAQRMKPVKEKVEQLQRDNQKLQAQVQTLTYRLAVRTHSSHKSSLDLADLQPTDSNQLSNYG